jgi:polyhydroxyalkanoate synthesis regulator phasin
MAERPASGKSGGTERKSAGEAEVGADKSLQAFRDALENNVTLSRDRLQEVLDDAVARGRITRDDANELLSRLIERGRHQTESLLKDLERLLQQVQRRLRG